MSSSSACHHLHALFKTARTTTSKLRTAEPTITTTSKLKTAKPTITTTDALNLSAPNNSSSSSSSVSFLKDTDNILETLVSKFKKASDSNQFRRQHRPYETTVRRLAAAHKFSDIEDILEHQKKYDDITNERFAVRLISLYGKSGMFDHARKLFDEMPQLNCHRTVLSFNFLLSACINSKKYDKIGELLSEIPEILSIKPDKVSYNVVIKAFCEVGSFDSALSVIDEMERNELEPDVITFNTILDGFYQNHSFSDAEKVWGLMREKNVVPNVRSYNPKLRALVADNRIEEAVELIEEMRRGGVMPDVFSFNALIRGFKEEGNIEEAKNWYSEMVKNGCNPDRVTLTILGYLACDKGDFDFALQLCKESIDRRQRVDGKMMQQVVDGLVKEAKELVKLSNSNNYFNYNLKVPSNE